MTCPHGMPNPKTCLDCMEEGNIEPPKWKAIGPPFDAIYTGSCADPNCNDIQFLRGDSIQRWDKEGMDTKYTHAYTCKMGG